MTLPNDVPTGRVRVLVLYDAPNKPPAQTIGPSGIVSGMVGSPRVFGLLHGAVHITDDFDAPLTNEFLDTESK